jgi:hypothetical protein
MSIEEFIALNKKIGNHWFSEGAMSFFGSKFHDWDSSSGYFISEQGPSSSDPRMFTIRKADFQTGRVSTFSSFQEFKTISEARTRFKKVIL